MSNLVLPTEHAADEHVQNQISFSIETAYGLRELFSSLSQENSSLIIGDQNSLETWWPQTQLS